MKPIESRICLESIQRHLKVPHTVIFCDNGSGEDYPLQFVRDGLVDQLIVNRDSRGLGLGTRDLFALNFSVYTILMQNDQFFARDLTQPEFSSMTQMLGGRNGRGQTISSISLAGAPCGDGIYSERAHLILTSTYKTWEERLPLGYHGAGPYHEGMWREEEIQRHYRFSNLIHLTWPVQSVQDNGVFAVRDMKEGGLYCHRTDTKALWVILPPTIRNPAYPKFNDEEYALAAAGQWSDGRVPAIEEKDSFRCWDHTPLAQMQDDYIKDLRRRVKERIS